MVSTIKKRNPTHKGGKLRLLFVGFLFFIIWAILLVRSAYVQLYKGDEYSKLASKQTLSREFECGRRGRILDREGNLLATSVEVSSVYVHPFQIKDKEKAANLLCSTLGLSKQKIAHIFSSTKSFVWVKRQIKDRQAALLAQSPMEGIYLTHEYVRLYPQGKLAGQVIGFVNIDGKGLEGIEQHFDAHMAGSKAEFVVQRDNLGHRLYLDAAGQEVSVDGHDVTLTIDSRIQALTEKALAKAVIEHKAKSGMVVVVDTASGDILALASMPFFNPNKIRSSAPGQRRLRPALDIYEPGSTMKPLLFAAALEQGTIHAGDRINCENGKYKIGTEWIHDHHSYAWLTTNEILRYSSNIGATKIAESLGTQNYFWYLSRLGFGKKPVLQLPAISSGKLRPVKDWQIFDLAAAAFGHGIGVTALQLTQAYMPLACDGELRPLRLIKQPLSLSGSPAPRIFSQNTVKETLAMMCEVVELDGTAKNIRIPELSIAGKTGTAQKPKNGTYSNDYLSSFVALVPGDKPQLLIITMIDEPSGRVNAGGKVAAPVARDIALGALAYSGHIPASSVQDGIQPAEPVKMSLSFPVSLSNKNTVNRMPDPGKTIPDMCGLPLRRALEILSQKGIVPEFKGKGTKVSRQSPQAEKTWSNHQKSQKPFILWLSSPKARKTHG